ncbi:hypothetical protein F5X98DRAFT_382193 [Xylaria grammica]|nr:hypothetical protein F5X98DRAFT_382193 [Xylaria grammica]
MATDAPSSTRIPREDSHGLALAALARVLRGTAASDLPCVDGKQREEDARGCDPLEPGLVSAPSTLLPPSSKAGAATEVGGLRGPTSSSSLPTGLSKINASDLGALGHRQEALRYFPSADDLGPQAVIRRAGPRGTKQGPRPVSLAQRAGPKAGPKSGLGARVSGERSDGTPKRNLSVLSPSPSPSPSPAPAAKHKEV